MNSLLQLFEVVLNFGVSNKIYFSVIVRFHWLKNVWFLVLFALIILAIIMQATERFRDSMAQNGNSLLDAKEVLRDRVVNVNPLRVDLSKVENFVIY